MIIIGVAGKKGSGKDEVYKAIESYYKLTNRTVQRIAFADSLKQEVSIATGRSIPYIEEHKENFRLILQGWGTDFKRKLMGDNYWIQRWMNKVNECKCDVVVAPDTRFLNEMLAIKHMDGKVWQVFRDLPSNNDKHSSETELDNREDFNLLLNNNYSILFLQQNVQLHLAMHAYTK